MKLCFNRVCEAVIQQFLNESIDAGFLRKTNAEVSVLKKKQNTPDIKGKLKQLSKDLIIHILNGNYKNILKNYFPNLVQFSNKGSDKAFKLRLEKELSENMMTSDMYKNLLKDIDNIIYDLSIRNNNELGYLIYLRASYLLTYESKH